MEELVQELIDKAGLTKEQAEKSVKVTLEYVRSKVPPMMQGMVDNFFGSTDTGDRIGE